MGPAKEPAIWIRFTGTRGHMGRTLRGVVLAFAIVAAASAAVAQSETVLFEEPGFPTADSGALSLTALQSGFAGAQVVNAQGLPAALKDPQTRLLVMPYGSAYPEEAWPAILAFLDRGGNLIVLGGKPFTRPVRHSDGWRLMAPANGAAALMRIDGYQQTPGSKSLQFAANKDVQPTLPEFQWERAFSPVIRLSGSLHFPSEPGSTGNEDSWITTLAWGEHEGHKLAAPAFLIDHVAARFAGGRWIFVACDADTKSLENRRLLSTLQSLALRKNDRFTFRPRVALFLPGEPIDFRFQPARAAHSEPGDELKISIQSEDGSHESFTFPADNSKPIPLPASVSTGSGLHTVEALLVRNNQPVWTYRSGFWMRDREYLLNGPKLTVGTDYFALDGKPLPVVGTTYMAGDVDRAYLWEPNPYVWDQDMKQMREAGINMLRSGIWSGWDVITNPDKSMKEDALRSVEAFLMTARKYGLPVQFNLFAFIPDLTGHGHPYLTQKAEQERFVSSIASRFHDVPFLAWDLINEPSPNRNLWRTVPNSEERADWSAWTVHNLPEGRRYKMPAAIELAEGAVHTGLEPPHFYDYQLFTQSFFRDWIERQHKTIHDAGSQQLITVGQDEGGVAGRLSPAFFSPAVSFTTTHTWWDFDSILWAGLMAKMPGEPMLVQETGEQRRVTENGNLRLSAEEESWQLSRKLAVSFAQGAGGIEWVWNVNSMMSNPNEVTIGAIRPDGTEKPEARVLGGYAQFARQHPASFTSIDAPAITVVVSQAELYSSLWTLTVDMQKKAVRALAYYDRQPLRMLPENRLADLGKPKLVILPSALALTDAAWEKLLNYVSAGGWLLITGPVDHNQYWEKVDRLTPLNVKATIAPIIVRQSSLTLPGSAQAVPISYPSAVQTAPMEFLRFADGDSVETIRHGAGTILWAADPVELAEGYDAPAALYAFAATKAGIPPAFTELHPLSPGVLAFPTMLKDAILYSFSNESLDDQPVDIQDATTGARMDFNLAAQQGALVLLDRATGKVLASYGISDGAKNAGSD
jgi:hypothetical protein